MSESTLLQTPLRRPLRGPHVGYMDNTAEHLARTSDAWLLILGWCERVTPWITNNQEEVVAEGEPISPPPGADDKPRRWFRLSLKTHKERQWTWRVSANNAALALINDTEIPSLPNGSPLWLTRFFGLLHEVQGQRRARQRRQRTWRCPSPEALEKAGLGNVDVTTLLDALVLVLYWQEHAQRWEERTKDQILSLLSVTREALRTHRTKEDFEAALQDGEFPPGHPLAPDLELQGRVHLLYQGMMRLYALSAIEKVRHGEKVPQIPIADSPPWARRLFHLLEVVHARWPAKEAAPETPTRRQPYRSHHLRGSHIPPFIPGQVVIISAAPIQGAAEFIASVEGMKGANLVRQTNAPPYGTVSNGHVFSYGGLTTASLGEAEATVLFEEAVRNLDDDALAALFICLAKWFADPGARDGLGFTRVHIGDYCSFRGYQKEPHGGYSTTVKKDATRAIMALKEVYVYGNDVGYEGQGKNRREIPIYTNSVILDIAPGNEDLFGQVGYYFDVRPGAWARDYLTEDNLKTAQFIRKVLQYDTSRPGITKTRLAMRLGIYYLMQHRNKGSYGNYDQPFKVSTVLSRIGIPIPTDRRKFSAFRDNFEDAHDLLQTDEVVKWEWAKGDDTTLPPSKWFEKWLGWTLQVLPVQSIQDKYAKMPEKRQQAIKSANKRGRPKKQRSAP